MVKRWIFDGLSWNWDQKYWNCKVFLCIKLTTITKINFLLVLYFWSSYCRCLKKLLIKRTKFINSVYTKKANKEAVCLAVLFFHVLPRHTNIMTGKGFNVFDECASRCVYLFPQEEEFTFFLEGTVKCTYLPI